LTSFFHGGNAAGASQRQRNQSVRGAVGDKCRLQRSLFAEIQCEQKFDFHQGSKETEVGNQDLTTIAFVSL
jgi:hypothetical protein